MIYVFFIMAMNPKLYLRKQKQTVLKTFSVCKCKYALSYQSNRINFNLENVYFIILLFLYFTNKYLISITTKY